MVRSQAACLQATTLIALQYLIMLFCFHQDVYATAMIDITKSMSPMRCNVIDLSSAVLASYSYHHLGVSTRTMSGRSRSETDLEKLTPPKDLEQEQRRVIFEHIYRRLAIHRNDVERYVINESFACPKDGRDKIREEFVEQVNKWANDLLENVWMACSEPASGELQSAFHHFVY